MIVIFNRGTKTYYVRPRCKECHNAAEQGYRREYKREYLRKWRQKNRQLNDSYWKDNPTVRERCRINAARRLAKDHDAILIQGRMSRKGMNVSIEEAKELLKKYGRCYPTLYGLTDKGRKECERIRARLRKRARRVPPSFMIRLMVYEDDDGEYKFVLRPELQPQPYQIAAQRLKNYHERRREELRTVKNL